MDTPKHNDNATTAPVVNVAIPNDGTFNAIAALVPMLNVGFDGPFVIRVDIAVGAAAVSSGYPEYVCAAAAPVAVLLAPGMSDPEISTTFVFVTLKLVCAIPICSLSRWYTTYADRINVSPKRIGSLPDPWIPHPQAGSWSGNDSACP